MAEIAVLDQPHLWKAVSHPLRLAILRALGDRERTNEELASELGVSSGKLHFHTKKLLDAGLIELAGTRQKGSVTEKLYRVRAHDFRIPMVEDGSAPPLLHLAHNAVQFYESAWRDATDKHFMQLGFHWMLYQTPENKVAFFDRLTALMAEFEAAAVDPSTPGATLVSFLGLIHATPNSGETP